MPAESRHNDSNFFIAGLTDDDTIVSYGIGKCRLLVRIDIIEISLLLLAVLSSSVILKYNRGASGIKLL
jgi:hypothetical protein